MFTQEMLEEDEIGVKRFSSLKNKRIVIYGTGKKTLQLMSWIKECQIVGIMDGFRKEREFEGYPIITMKDLPGLGTDILVVASLPDYYREIYQRVEHVCLAYGISVYGMYGENLTECYGNEWNFRDAAEYYPKSFEELKNRIMEYDAVSFDVFDTLIMRKVLEPLDVLDLVEEGLKQQDITIPKFKYQRRLEERRAGNRNFEEVYHHVQIQLSLDDDTTHRIMQTELEIDKKCLVPRYDMVELMRFAIAAGKRVNLISNTCLPKKILEEWLGSMGIAGYEDLFLSCEYRVEKECENGLYQIYKNKIGNARALHIGAGSDANILQAQKCGLDLYSIKSAYEMLQISHLRQCMLLTKDIGTRTWLGMLIADLFNSPFALSHTYGEPTVGDLGKLAKVFVAPTAFHYVQTLIDHVRQNPYDRILMTARDCYLFQKIYDKYSQYMDLPPAVYLLASRRLCLAAVLYGEKDIADVEKAFITNQTRMQFWMQFMELDPESMPEKEFTERVLTKAAQIRKYYLSYLESEGVQGKHKYLLCDLISSGTVREALERLLGNPLDAFFLCENPFPWSAAEDASITEVKNGYIRNGFMDKHFFLEEVLTSLQPSVKEIGEDGTAIYLQENRSKRELQQVKEIHDAVLSFISEFQMICGMEAGIDETLAERLLNLSGKMILQGEALDFLSNQNDDDFRGDIIDIRKEFMR